MSVAALDLLADNQAARAAADTNSKKFTDATERSVLFSSLLQGQVPQNVTFSRIERELDAPEAASVGADEFDYAPIDEDGYADSVEEADDFSEAINYNPVQAERPTPRPEQNKGPDQSVEAVDTAAPAQTEDATAAAAVNTPNEAQQETHAVAGPAEQPGHNQRISEAFAAQQAKSTNASVMQRAATGPAEAAPEVQITQAAMDGKKSGPAAGQIKATVTKSEQTIAQPTNAVAASTLATTQSVQQNQTGTTPLTATQLANAASDEALATAPRPQATPSMAAQNGAAGINEAQNTNGANAGAQQAGQPNPSATAQQFATLMATNQAQPAQAGGASAGGLAGAVSSDTPAIATPVQNGHGTTPARATAQAAASQRPSVPQAFITEQVAVNIHRAANQGLDRINIQLRPAELGKIDIRMEVAQDGRMTAVVNVEKQETYDMLRNDARQLAQTLQNAGLQTDASSLSFNLNGQGGQQTAQSQTNSGGSNGFSASGAPSEEGDLIAGAEDGLLGLGEDVEVDEDGSYDVKV